MFHILSTPQQYRAKEMMFSLKTGDAQHVAKHMAHHLVLTSTTIVYYNYNLQRVVLTRHIYKLV